MKKCILVIFIFSVISALLLTACTGRKTINQSKNVAIGGFLNEEEGIYCYAKLDENGTAEFYIVNIESGITEKSIIEDIKSISAGLHAMAGIKNDGTVYIVDYLNSYEITEMEKLYDDWNNICMVEFTLYYTFGLKYDGTILVKERNENNESELPKDVLEVSKWDNIRYISSNSIGLQAVTDKGRILSFNVPNNLSSKTSRWKNISNLCNGSFCTAAVTDDGKVKLDTYSMGVGLADMSDLEHISKIEIGIDYVAALQDDGTLIIKIFIDGTSMMSDELIELDGMKNVHDIDSYSGNLIVLKDDGEVYIIEERDN